MHLGEWIGHRAVIEELERRFTEGEIDSADVADRDAPYYKGRSIAEVAEAMTRAPCIDDIREGVEQLASRGVDALLCTVTWSFAAQCVADQFGFSAVSGTVMHVDGDGILAGRVAQYFEPEDKVAFLRDYCESRDLSMNQVVAIGDGRSDLPMFDAAGFSVGLNASPAARAAASVSVDSHSFLDALPRRSRPTRRLTSIEVVGKELLRAELSLPRRGRQRVERGAGSGLEGVLPSRAERRLAGGGSEGRDAVFDVAVAGADLPWLVVRAAAATEFVCGAEELGCDLGAARFDRR